MAKAASNGFVAVGDWASGSTGLLETVTGEEASGSVFLSLDLRKNVNRFERRLTVC